MDGTIKDSLTDLLIENNLTLTDLSEKINMEYKMLSTYLNGTYMPSLKNALILANYFKCSLDYLVGLADNAENCDFTEPDNKFYERYRNHLIEQNISHYKLTKDLGLNINISRRWKIGTIPTFRVLAQIANYLEISVDELIGRKPIKSK